MEIRFLGHAAVMLTEGETSVLVDPFLSGNPSAAVSPDEPRPSVIALSHGHGDHLGDTVAIAKRAGAPVVAVKEVADEVGEEGVDVFDPNLGGTVPFDWGWIKLVPAWHTSTTHKGTTGIATGLVISLGGRIVYHLGDTALFSDLSLVGRRDPVDVALVPIGGHYTMDRVDAVAAVELVRPELVIPIHYDTFPPIETDARAFKADVEDRTDARCVVLAPGETHTV